MSKIYLPNSTQLDTLNEKVGAIGDTLAGQQLVTKDAVVNALQYTPAAEEGTYELIETITVENNVRSYSRTQEPDGTAYSFKGVYIVFASPTEGLSSAVLCAYNIYFNDTTGIYNYAPGTFPANKSGQSTALLRLNGNGVATLQAQTVQTSGNWEANTPRTSVRLVTAGSVVNKMAWYVSSDAAGGATIQIYAIRAK